MQRNILLVGIAAALTGCAVQNHAPVSSYYPPSPPPGRVQRHAQLPLKPAAEEARARPEEVKPLGKGLLTALTVGNYMDDQEKELRTDLRGRSVISRVGDDLVVNIDADSLFTGKSAELSRNGQTIMQAVAHSVRKFDSTTLSINGFTDTAGPPDKDLKESQLRADAVEAALAEGGVDARRLAAKGFGAENPRIATGPDVREARNRRIEIEIAPRLKT